ncbi:hypothetical protein ACO0LF_30645 [Undibacterium sp. Di27W]|uniref:hypothetical protein n=1 Tax=Undibacterium sp. Di27W TaxID=3413036 RepID=UPI003BF43CA8
MGIQVIVKTGSASEIASVLGTIATDCEIFPIDEANWGVSIPTKLIDAVGEKSIRVALDKLVHFDLWAGSWKMPLQV